MTKGVGARSGGLAAPPTRIPSHGAMLGPCPSAKAASVGEGVPSLLSDPVPVHSLGCSQMALRLRAAKGRQDLAWPQTWR